MYFETGQSRRSRAAHRRRPADLKTRAYAVARQFRPLLVNTVVGFVGPEYLYNGKQIMRAGLEDLFCGKLLELPIGCDVCYTNHAEADRDGCGANVGGRAKRGQELAPDQAARTAFQISGAVLFLTRSLPSLN